MQNTSMESYSWTYPYIKCLNNVPSSTSGFSSANTNLTCVVDCSTDGGYSNAPIDILTDCTSASSSMNMLTSERSKNISLSADAHFYLAYRGNAWVALNYPTQQGLDWSIVTHIDLRKRLDGFINTPPVAKVVSPQYVIVNRTVQINIPVSDANVGDDVRCRWSTYTTGYRRRKRSDTKEHSKHRSDIHFYSQVTSDRESIHIRNRRTHCSNCTTSCVRGCPCICPTCDFTCTGSTCNKTAGCYTTVATTTINTTTTETPGTPKSTSTFPIRQAVDECADICYPNGVPNDTTLSNCTITFTATKAGVWYAVAIQVEDFIDTTSMTPMSSVPVQFLIYVQSQPACSIEPIIFPLDRCLEVQVGVSISFNLSAMNLCNASVATLTGIIVSSGITGMNRGNLTRSSTNSSIYYVLFTWTPQTNQVGLQELCTIAYTSENLPSDQYCVTFTLLLQRPRPQQPLPQRLLPQQPLPQRPLPQQPLPQQLLPQRPLPQQPLPQPPLPQQPLPQRPLPQQPLPQRALLQQRHRQLQPLR
ncbi:unnamed protein product [Rotaria sordida]|uniref:Uncharacterized protein n=1 Tax=Rotaria sordida TaxID=392033 RepID=A0A819C6K8_9BILA|nr:unnamed protein product [Rotaria sordida]